MTFSITLDDKASERLAYLAEATSRTPEQVATALIERNLARGLSDRDEEQELAPVRQAFEASGMTEDELSELLESEKHAWRREQRVTGQP